MYRYIRTYVRTYVRTYSCICGSQCKGLRLKGFNACLCPGLFSFSRVKACHAEVDPPTHPPTGILLQSLWSNEHRISAKSYAKMDSNPRLGRRKSRFWRGVWDICRAQMSSGLQEGREGEREKEGGMEGRKEGEREGGRERESQAGPTDIYIHAFCDFHVFVCPYTVTAQAQFYVITICSQCSKKCLRTCTCRYSYSWSLLVC